MRARGAQGPGETNRQSGRYENVDGEGRSPADESLTRRTQAPPALHNDLGVRNGSARSSRASARGLQRAGAGGAGKGITFNQIPELDGDLDGFKTPPGPISPRSPTDSNAPSEYSDAAGIDDPKSLPYPESGPPRPGNLKNSFAKDWTRASGRTNLQPPPLGRGSGRGTGPWQHQADGGGYYPGAALAIAPNGYDPVRSSSPNDFVAYAQFGARAEGSASRPM